MAPAPASPAPLDLLVDAFAAYRLTRLATADVISEPWRRSVVDRVVAPGPENDEALRSDTAQEVVDALIDPPKVARLITCRWCAGIWIAGGVVAARTLVPRAWAPVSQALALSAVATLLARAESD